MKKIFRCLLFAFLFLPVLMSSAFADDTTDSVARLTGIENAQSVLPDETKEISGSLNADGRYDAQGALARLFDKCLLELRREVKENISDVLGLVAIAVCSALTGSFAKDPAIRDYISIAAVCAAAGTLIGGLDGLVEQTSIALTQMSDYSRAALPAVFTAAGVCGALVSASARCAAVCIAIDILMSAAQGFVIPLVYAYLALALSGAIFDNPVLKSCQRFSKWLATTFMTGFTIVFSGYIGLTGIVTSGVDAVAARTARTVISTALPVVGGIISDAAATLLSAAGIIKNSAGALSLVAVAALCAAPFAALSAKLLLFRAAACACDMVPNVKLSAFINDVGTALGILLGLVGCCAIMLFISFTTAIRMVSVS